jgi:bile acid:Na+ symporter, BASS family
MQAVQVFVEAYVIPLQLVLAMLGMGATVTVRDFIQVAREAKGVAVGLFLQLILVPLTAVAFITAFDLSKGWAVGLMLVAVVPGGTFSNLLTFLARGNVALSLAVTTTTTILCLGTVPLLLGLLVGQHVPPDFAMPIGTIVKEIGSYLMAPLALGMVVLRVDPARARPMSQWSIRVSALLIVAIVASSLGSGRIDVAAYGWRPPLLLVLFGVVLLVGAPWVCRLLRRYDDDTVALGLEVTLRNIGLGLLLVRFFFPGAPEQGQVLYTCLFYGGAQMFLSLPLVLGHRAGIAPALLLAPRPRPEAPAPGANTGLEGASVSRRGRG